MYEEKKVPLGHGVFLNTFGGRYIRDSSHRRLNTGGVCFHLCRLASTSSRRNTSCQMTLHHPMEYAVDSNIDCGILSDN